MRKINNFLSFHHFCFVFSIIAFVCQKPPETSPPPPLKKKLKQSPLKIVLLSNCCCCCFDSGVTRSTTNKKKIFPSLEPSKIPETNHQNCFIFNVFMVLFSNKNHPLKPQMVSIKLIELSLFLKFSVLNLLVFKSPDSSLLAQFSAIISASAFLSCSNPSLGFVNKIRWQITNLFIAKIKLQIFLRIKNTLFLF